MLDRFNAWLKSAKFDGALFKSKALPHDENGHEIPDPIPLAPPVDYVKLPSLYDQVRQMVRSEQLRMAAELQGAETFEDADDFDVDDDFDPRTRYEEVFEGRSAKELRKMRQEANEKARQEASEARAEALSEKGSSSSSKPLKAARRGAAAPREGDALIDGEE